MKRVKFKTSVKKILADAFTPVGIYLRLRDRFRDTILLESTDFHAGENSYSIIGINAVAGIEISNFETIEFKMPGANPEKEKLGSLDNLADAMAAFTNRFEAEPPEDKVINRAQGLFGYTSYDAIPFFEKITFGKKIDEYDLTVPLLRYRMYQYVIIINHFKDEMFLCENLFPGLDSKVTEVESIIRSKDVPVFPFKTNGEETTNITDAAYKKMVSAGISACHRGDVFQVVLSRRFMQGFTGDEFNVYRALRSINPSPYLFYFDYGDYKLMGSSPESQVIVKNGKAIVHPIAGTVKRTGDDETDRSLALQLENDAKENAEHVMLVDLARNDLSRVCNNVSVTAFKEVHYYSHVIHLVSEVQGTLNEDKNPFSILGSTFPAGTLSGAPKYKAMQIIDEQETTARGWYGGAIGFMGLNGSCNHAIMIRTFLSKNNTLVYQAGAGVVAASLPENELQEVNNKLGALKKAVLMAEALDS
jgi:anthranilate synthase component I